MTGTTSFGESKNDRTHECNKPDQESHCPNDDTDVHILLIFFLNELLPSAGAEGCSSIAINYGNRALPRDSVMYLSKLNDLCADGKSHRSANLNTAKGARTALEQRQC